VVNFFVQKSAGKYETADYTGSLRTAVLNKYCRRKGSARPEA
jgi:hypothetical protein